ncbi:hypothetical protein CRG98_004026 [Punica granatum]|uniref:Uncharacterized protein n=1 Tax=Punica granatum TaxID=22663 RepID=A0A2I0L4J2_PUNGR|nr:hypothetical protein CRG98_004026 [Punica granatum]
MARRIARPSAWSGDEVAPSDSNSRPVPTRRALGLLLESPFHRPRLLLCYGPNITCMGPKFTYVSRGFSIASIWVDRLNEAGEDAGDRAHSLIRSIGGQKMAS